MPYERGAFHERVRSKVALGICHCGKELVISVFQVHTGQHESLRALRAPFPSGLCFPSSCLQETRHAHVFLGHGQERGHPWHHAGTWHGGGDAEP